MEVQIDCCCLSHKDSSQHAGMPRNASASAEVGAAAQKLQNAEAQLPGPSG